MQTPIKVNFTSSERSTEIEIGMADVFLSNITCKWLANPTFKANMLASIIVKVMKLDNKFGYEPGPTFHDP